MAVGVDHIETEIVEGFADGDFLHLAVYKIGSGEDGALGRAIAVVELEPSGGREGGQFLAAGREVEERMAVNASGKLIGHLCGHERMGDAGLLEIVVERDKIEAQLLGNNINGSATSEGGIEVHHAGIEAITGIGGHTVLGSKGVVALIPMAESDDVGLEELAAFGNTGGARSVEKYEKAVGAGTLGQRVSGREGWEVAGEKNIALILVDQRTERLVGNQQLGAGILHHEVQALLGIARVERLIGATGLEHTERGNGHPLATGDEH